MSDPTTEADLAGSQLACFCTELERLARTVGGMLSQCEALGSPLGEDRPSVEALLPTVQDLHGCITAALAADAELALEDTPEPEPTPLVRTTGARFIEWNAGATEAPEPGVIEDATDLAMGGDKDTLSEHVDDDLALLSNPAEEESPALPESREPSTAEAPADAPIASDIQIDINLGDAEDASSFPDVDRCAELLMTDLSEECGSDENEKGEVTLQGTNESLPLPSVFQFLGQTTKSGTLRVKTNRETMRFEFSLGDLVFSSTDNPPHDQLLGEILVAQDFVTRDNLDAALAQISENPGRLGGILEDDNILSFEDLRSALKTQIKNRLDRAFEAPESAFTFSEGSRDRPHHRIKMNVTQLLLESL